MKDMKSLIKNGITMLCLAVIFAVALPAHAKKDDKDGDKDSDTDTQTIYQILQHTEGSQALFAAILYNDESFHDGGIEGCNTNLKKLLDDKKKKLHLFGPSNRGLAKFFLLHQGGRGFDGMDAKAIELALPGLLARRELSEGDGRKAICELLQRHIVPTKDAKKKAAEKLLQQDSITVGIGGHVTEHEVRAINGLIHYIDNVLVEPPPPEEPKTDVPLTICNELDCGLQETECTQYVALCNASSLDTDDCIQGAILICADINIGDGL
jgi:hypothetical protein